MKKLLFLLLLSTSTIANDSYSWKINRVIDGDTLEIQQDFLPKELDLKVRLLGIDTPEKAGRAHCKSEADLAIEATRITQEIIDVANKNGESFIFTNIKWDKFGGRIDADVFIGKRSLSQELIKLGVARPYNGGLKQSWCIGE